MLPGPFLLADPEWKMRVAGLMVLGLLLTGCASGMHPIERGGALKYEPHEEGSRPVPSERGRQRFSRQVRARETTRLVAGVEPDTALTREAVLAAINEAKDSAKRIEAARLELATRPTSLGGRGLDGVFTRYLDHGASQMEWVRRALGSASVRVTVASDVEDPEMELALLRMSGSRLQAALFGTVLLAAWVDFLQLADALLRDCPMCGTEKLFADMHHVQGLMEPTLKELASLDPERVEVAATGMPELMGKLTREFDAIHRDARSVMESGGKIMVAIQVMEMLALISTLKMSLPRLPPSTPATLGTGLVMSSGGVMAGSQLVVSAEWVEMMRRLVQAGVISLPVVSAAVRIHGGQVMMSQTRQDLPKGVRDALGDSPEVRGMQVTGKAGAGMSEAPKHHVLPKEHRAWFEQRGFRGDMDIDQFCVRLEQADHEAIHGGANWKLGRTWPGEWNRMIMKALGDAESATGRTLTRNEILNLVAKSMRDYRIPMSFTRGRGR
ncbi:DUF2380 domain-containing protein [Myxococcus sp. MISCRS1]|uniref:DUF2380 domain-containing protein n=1 Tax=Myxococcus sp. MISCRS1 TaxID=2996786 RepID=UPI00226E754E|nr:DUF2380 domain-containing protein [Myxococcus sp. MISCRS1]MCY1001335.1 DUF2380 domain-containing protein [Myxococcus sp. MISCRS1]